MRAEALALDGFTAILRHPAMAHAAAYAQMVQERLFGAACAFGISFEQVQKEVQEIVSTTFLTWPEAVDSWRSEKNAEIARLYEVQWPEVQL